MENILNNISWWGGVAMFYTTVRLIGYVLTVKSINKVQKISNTINTQLRYFLSVSYKPLIMLIVATLLLKFVEQRAYINTSLSIEAFWISILLASLSLLFSYMASKVASRNKLTKAIYLFWGLNAPASIGALLFLLLGILLWVVNVLPTLNNLYQLLHIWLSIITACCLAYLTYYIWRYPYHTVKYTYHKFFLSRERLDAIIGATLGASMLGIIFWVNASSQQIGWVGLPVLLMICFLALSTVAQLVMVLIPYKRVRWQINLGRLLIVGLLGLLAWYMVRILLPEHWMLHGHSYHRMQILYTIWLGLITGFLSDKIIQLYKYIQHHYTHHFTQKPVRHKYLTFLLRFCITVMCLTLILLAILYAYWNIGLYGLTLAIIALMANTTTKVSLSLPAKV
mgnify:CR=1 FL=1